VRIRVTATWALTRRPSQFALVGLLGLVVNSLVLYLLTSRLGIYYLVSAVLASVVSTLQNFLLTEWWVFRDRETGGRRAVIRRYVAFNVLTIATLAFRVPAMALLTEFAGLYYLVSNAIAIGLTFAVRYVVADVWLWAGRDRRDQVRVDGWFAYDLHGMVGIRSQVPLAELAVFNVDRSVAPDLIVERHALLGGRPRAHVAVTRTGETIRYREHLGLAGAAFDIDLGPRPTIRANWLLTRSQHVLYTNVVEPLLRFLLIDRDAVLLHSAGVVDGRGAVLISAPTDTGKTSTVLKLLRHEPWSYLADDMIVLSAAGRAHQFAKPMTLSSHTMHAISTGRLPVRDRAMLAVRSRVHSKRGRSIGHALARWNVPIVTINAWLQLIVPPPKYHLESLLDSEVTKSAQLEAVFLLGQGPSSVRRPSPQEALETLVANTEDAYTFPPFAKLAPLIRLGQRDEKALRRRERSLLAAAIDRASLICLSDPDHAWYQAIPGLVRDSRAAPVSAGPGLVGAPIAAAAPSR